MFSLPSRYTNFVLTVACILFLMSHPASAESASDVETRNLSDCGTNALFLLLELTGHPQPLETVLEHLPARHPDGFSMLELQQAAQRCGLRTVGRALTRQELPLKRPVIAHLEPHGTSAGHFVVLVPVGRTGTMVQMIDPPYPAVIVDYDRVFHGKEAIPILEPRTLIQSIASSQILILLTASLLLFVCFLIPSVRHRVWRLSFLASSKRMLTKV